MTFNFKKMRDSAVGLVRRAGSSITRLTSRRQAPPERQPVAKRPPKTITRTRKQFGPGLRPETKRRQRLLRRLSNERARCEGRADRRDRSSAGRFGAASTQAIVQLMANHERTLWARAKYPTDEASLLTFCARERIRRRALEAGA